MQHRDSFQALWQLKAHLWKKQISKLVVTVLKKEKIEFPSTEPNVAREISPKPLR